MKTFIRSSARLCTKPGYYRKIADRLQPKRDALLDAAEAKGDVFTTDRDSDERRQADKLTAKIRWAISMNVAQVNMLAEANRS